MKYKFIQANILDKHKDSKVLAEIKDIKMTVKFGNLNKLVINDTSLKIREGEILGIIGESGSGKTLITNTLTGIIADDQKIWEGKVILDGHDVTNWSLSDWRKSKLRGKIVSTVYQNPSTSLNPHRKIGSQIIESIRINSEKEISEKEAIEIAVKLLTSVKITDPLIVMDLYPHQISSGLSQRIVIVSILAAQPKLIIFDEPTSGLDAAVQAQIIEIIREINHVNKTAIIFISNDIALVSSIADRVAIMYAGKVVEEGLTSEVIHYPLHPYTWGLLRSLPELNKGGKLYSIPGVLVGDINLIKGDAFAPRNEYAQEIDFLVKPPKFTASETHFVWSWLYDERAPKFTPPTLIVEKWSAFAKTASKRKTELTRELKLMKEQVKKHV